MKGLELAEKYFEEIGRPMLAAEFWADQKRIAAGLAGEGSDCFGFDDEISRDHDWGPGFCLWLTAADYERFGADLQSAYDALPKAFAGFGPRRDMGADKRHGVFEIKDFYRRFVRFDYVPATLAEWRVLPETFLATATNGKVFTDPLGEFTAFREGLLAFYPRDVQLKKLAARCFTAGQAGQYNFKRTVDRGDLVAAHVGLSQFIEAVTSAVYLLNKKYRPFYKWMHRGLPGLPVLGGELHRLLDGLCSRPGQTAPEAPAEQVKIVEDISALLIGHLTFEGLSDAESDFLIDHAYSVQCRIENEALRNMPVMTE
jgi:hypothetical protein